MKVRKGLVIFDSLGQSFSTLNANDVSIEQKFGQELLVLKAVGEIWDTVL